MVSCDRCHRKFPSYAALDQHYDRKHPNAMKPTNLMEKATVERQSISDYRPSFRSGGSSHLKVAVFLLVLIVAAGVIGYVALLPKEQGTRKAVDIGSVAPDFALTDTTGKTFTLSDFKGKSNVLLFFNEGLACAPCLQQMQTMDQLNQQFTSLNVVMASITSDQMGGLSSWAQASGPKYGMVLSDPNSQISRAYDMLGNSMHGTGGGHSFILVNMSGIVAWRQDYYPPSMGPVANSEILDRVTRALGR